MYLCPNKRNEIYKRIAYYIQQEYDVHLSKRVQNLSVMKYCIEYPFE